MLPKIFHHTWFGTKKYPFPEYRESWIKHHPDYEFHYWDESNIPRDLLAKETLEIIDDPKMSLVSKGDSMKFDLIRIFGGIYLDMDMECLKPIDDIFNNEEFAAENRKGHLDTGIFGSVPNGEWITSLSNAINKNILNNLDAAYNMYMDENFFQNFALAGTRSLGDKLRLCKKIYPTEIFYPNETTSIEDAHAIHNFSKTQTGRWFRS